MVLDQREGQRIHRCIILKSRNHHRAILQRNSGKGRLSGKTKTGRHTQKKHEPACQWKSVRDYWFGDLERPSRIGGTNPKAPLASPAWLPDPVEGWCAALNWITLACFVQLCFGSLFLMFLGAPSTKHHSILRAIKSRGNGSSGIPSRFFGRGQGGSGATNLTVTGRSPGPGRVRITSPVRTLVGCWLLCGWSWGRRSCFLEALFSRQRNQQNQRNLASQGSSTGFAGSPGAKRAGAGFPARSDSTRVTSSDRS
jgi:hypothetical protein